MVFVTARFRVGIPGVAIAALLVSACGEAGPEEGGVAPDMEVAEAGLLGPSDVVYDSVADVYLVSNMNGDPLAQDENGFISRVSPDGEMLTLEWARSVPPNDLLNAPKGMAFRGDSLFVADIRCIRILNRTTGASEGQSCLEDVTSLSGVAVGPEGSVFVTDAGFELADGERVASGTDAVYRLVFNEARQGATLARDEELGHPTGIAVGSRGIFVTTAEGTLMRLTPNGDRTDMISTPGNSYEGVVFLADGGFAYASSTDGSVRRVTPDGQVSVVAEGLGAPADLGYDPSRNRLLVPIPSENRVVFVDL